MNTALRFRTERSEHNKLFIVSIVRSRDEQTKAKMDKIFLSFPGFELKGFAHASFNRCHDLALNYKFFLRGFKIRAY